MEMVTRVASFGRSQALIAQVMAAQLRSQQSEAQSSTGRKAEDYQGYGIDASRLIGAKTYLATTQAGLDSATQLKATIDAQQSALDRVRGVLQRFTKSVQDSVSGFSANGLMTSADLSLSSLVSELNATQNGSYLFGGTRSTPAPVATTAATPTGILALASASAAFDQAGQARTVTITGSGSVTFGALARNVGTNILQVMQNIYKYNNGTSTLAGFVGGTALTGTLTTAQQNFLANQLGLLAAADAPLVDISVTGSFAQNQVADMITRLTAQKTAATKFISDIQDVDIAAATTRMNDDRAAVDVATKVLASVNKSNLLDYL